ncbi:MAG: Ig-like domain-containing protein [Deltaproteobacteria bacterium]|nr:Ig-like domain-containing protein [Deltaproteobacteria bacterium]
MPTGSAPSVVRTAPDEGATGVDRATPLRVFYDRALDPRTVGRAEIALTSGELAHFLEVRFDPVARSVVVRPFRGQRLEPNVRYTLTIDGVRDLDGTDAEPFALTFVTGENAVDPSPSGTTEWATVEPIFAAHCVEGCHDGDGGLSLDLTSLEATRRSALGVPADQTGGTATIGRLGLSGMARIEESDPSRSYLIYKMLADPHVWGEAMPPAGPLPLSDVALVADWILGGAR